MGASRVNQEEKEDELPSFSLRSKKCLSMWGMVLVLAGGYFLLVSSSSKNVHHMHMRQRNKTTNAVKDAAFPPELQSVYSPQDFVNNRGIAPPFWSLPLTMNASMDCASDPQSCMQNTWGPCYPPVASSKFHWADAIQHAQNDTIEHRLSYPTIPRRPALYAKVPNPDLAGYCRPGFIIIGAGKCGTSSLYHYLLGHPRVLPASQKQIHYFKYHFGYSTRWYLAHFPTATSFLSSGALMTGEASPGYLPYPEVAHMAVGRMPGPKIICIGREPLDRAWSSYKYNYVSPALERLRKGRQTGVPRHQSDEFYQKYLFSFQDMMQAELDRLKECLVPVGAAEVGALQTWGDKKWFKEEFQRRADNGLAPMVDLDRFCYGEAVNRKVPRPQWKQLIEQYPDKILNNMPDLHLVQSFIGRGLYTLPLEWWYATHGAENVYFVCTEEMKDTSGEPLNQLGQYLGLPSYNFSSVVSAGEYNAGYNKGYNKETTWEDVKKRDKQNAGIPISDELRREVLEFVRPFNERLFELTGKRCDW